MGCGWCGSDVDTGEKDAGVLFLVSVYTVSHYPFTFHVSLQWLWPGVSWLIMHPDCNPLSPLPFCLISDALTVSFLMTMIWGQEERGSGMYTTLVFTIPGSQRIRVTWEWTVEPKLGRMRAWKLLYTPTFVSQVSR